MPLLFRALALLAILGATLFPAPRGRERGLLLCLLCADDAIADLVTNIILFLPLGAALALGGRRVRPVSLRWTVAAGALLSLAVEFTQFTLPGRDPNLSDVLANTIGSGLGWTAARHARPWLFPAAGTASVLSVAAALLAAAGWGVTGWVLQPSLPQAAYYGQWTPDLEHLQPYRGKVLQAWLGARPLPGVRLSWSAQARELLLRGARLRVRAVAGPPPRALAPLVSIYDEHEREIFLVGVDRTDLVLRYRTRADGLGLDRPDLRLRGALARVGGGDRLSVSVERSSPGYCVALNGLRRCGLAFTLGRGWALLLYPESFPGWLMALLDAAWLGAPMALVGFWWRPGFLGYVAMGTVLAGLVSAPALTGLQAVSLLELAGILAGAAAGWGLHVLATRRRTPSSPPSGPGVV